MKEFLTERELCSLLKVSRGMLRMKRLNEGLPYVQLGKLIRYPVRDVMDWIKERSRGGVAREHKD